MSDRKQNFAEMSTGRLRELLRADFCADAEDGLSGEELLEINRILAEREPESAEDMPSASELWQRFERDYLPDFESGSLYADGEDAEPEPVPASKRGRRIRWRSVAVSRVASVLLVVLLLVGAGAVTAEAAGYGSWEAISRLAYGAFRWDGESAAQLPLREVLAAYDMTEPVAPAYIPEGYSLDWVNISQDAVRVNFYAKYENRDAEVLTVLVTCYFPDADEGPAPVTEGESYTAGGIEHRIAERAGRRSAAWVNGRYECSISGSISEAEMRAMIDSIYGE